MGLLLCDGAAVASAGCAGLWQLCDAVRAVGCRSRFVLLAQQAIPCHAIAGRDPHDVERRRGLSQTSEDSSRRRLARGRMTAFLSPSGNCNIGSMAMAAQDAVAAASMRKIMR